MSPELKQLAEQLEKTEPITAVSPLLPPGLSYFVRRELARYPIDKQPEIYGKSAAIWGDRVTATNIRLIGNRVMGIVIP